MLKTFIQERAEKWDELIQIDTESKKVKIYSVDKELGFPFSEYYTTVTGMGYKSSEKMISAMKLRKKEIATEEQMEKEIVGLLNLAKYRKDHNKHFYLILNDGSRYDDIAERMGAYGISIQEAEDRINQAIG